MSANHPTRQGALVGLFALIGVAILLLAVFTIGGMNAAFTQKIQISAVFAQVDGLKTGDSIWFSGVPVGTIGNVTFTPGPKVQVSMKVETTAARFIPSDAVAQISSDGLIGNKIVVLTGGTAGGDSLEDGDELGVDIAISMTQLMDELKVTNDNLQAITSDVKGITARISKGEGTVGKLLADDTLYVDLKSAVGNLERASAQANTIGGDVARFTADLNTAGNLPHALVTDKTTYPALVTAVDALQVSAKNAQDITTGIQAGMADASTPVGVLLHDQQAGTDVGEALDHLNRGSKLLEEDLEALQHNIFLRGFFKKRDRAARKAAEGA